MLLEVSLSSWSVHLEMNTPLDGQLDMELIICRFNYLITPRDVVLMFLLLGGPPLAADDAFARETASMQQKLRRQVSATWQGQELAAALDRLATANQISLWRDRRVDWQQTISIRIVDLPLADAFQQISRQHNLGFVPLETIAYGGPYQTAQELPALIRESRSQLRRASAKQRKRWLREESVQWPRLTEPRALVQRWLDEAEIELVGSDRIAHDLWAAHQLPPMALVDRLVLVLAGFDKTCAIRPDGKSCEIVSITRPLKRARLATPSQRLSGNAAKPRTKRKTSQRFTLKLENQPLGIVLDQLAEQLKLEIAWRSSQQRTARELLVSCEVQDVELDELLGSLLDPVGLQHTRADKQIRIEKKHEPE